MFYDLTRRLAALTRSVSPENRTGAKGQGGRTSVEEGSAGDCARDLGIGWKTNPFLVQPPGSTVVLADVAGSGVIKHIWLTPTGNKRLQILRIYWDGEAAPSVECPLGDFFACANEEFRQLNSLAVCVNPGSAFNCYWEMPFRRSFRIEVENLTEETVKIYYQIDYLEQEMPKDIVYFHAQFRRVDPLPYKEVYTILDGVTGSGHYVGTYLYWQVNNSGWWGEGEIKFYLDGDDEYPTICGTGTEDYFCGSYNFENQTTHRYQEFCSPYSGLSSVSVPDGVYRSQQRFSLYRWHLTDPVVFAKDLRVTIQALGWRRGMRYLPLQDSISSVAYWYQTLPAAAFPPLPPADGLEIV